MLKEFLTIQELKELNKKLKNLNEIEKPKIIEEIKRAKLMGDLSENSEFQYAKKKKFSIENKIKEIESKLSLCEIVNKKENKESKIKLKNIKNNKIFEYNLNENNNKNIHIKNLIKYKKINDFITIKKYNKEIIFKIISIE